MANLSLLVLRTANLDAALKFYQAVGLAFVEEKHGNGPTHYACETDGMVIEIYAGEPGNAPNTKSGGATMLGFNVASLDATLDSLKQMEITPQSSPKESSWGRQCTVFDPDGRAVNLSEAKP